MGEKAKLHNHTFASQKDSTMSPETLVKQAKAIGAPAVAISDHGVMFGILPFAAACEKEGIKGIYGVELYVLDDLGKRTHLCVYAKDYHGYQGLMKAVTATNDNFSDGYPCANTKILKRFFGPGAPYHGEVVATSACMQGVLAAILLKNGTVQHEIDKLRRKQAKYSSPDEESYVENKKLLQEAETRLTELKEQKKALQKLVTRPFKGREKKLESLQKKAGADDQAVKTLYAELEADKAESAQAAADLEVLSAKTLPRQERLVKTLKAAVSGPEKEHERWRLVASQIRELENKLASDDELRQETVEAAKGYNNLFGDGNFFVELQHHGIPEEAKAMPILAEIARELSLPVVAANDAHVARKDEDLFRARNRVQCLRFNKHQDITDSDRELYLKTDEELSDALRQILPESVVWEALKGVDRITEMCNVKFPKESHAPRFIDEAGNRLEMADARKRLRDMCYANIERCYPGDAWTPEHEKRLEYELGVIMGETHDKFNYTDYFLIVEDFIRYGRSLVDIGLGTGTGRGSAVGSIVAYLTGITGVDPMRYGLIFERFLNTERISMPDIDTDFAIDIRGDVIDYVRHKYGEHAVCNIMTKGTLAAKAAVRNAARIWGDERYGDIKRCLSLRDAIAKQIPSAPGTKLADCTEALEKFKGNKDAEAIIKDAFLIEGAPVQVGMHAAGFIISDNEDVTDYIPLMRRDEKEPLMSQCDMVEAEEKAGLLKMDFLGLRNLNIINQTLEFIRRDTGKVIDIEAVGRDLAKDGRTTKYDPDGRNVFDEIFSKGLTSAVFQFESGGMKKMLKQFRPRTIDDVILLVACYRPGPMQYLEQIIDIKWGRTKAHYIIPQLEDILGITYGSPVYQEQVMSILSQVAGFSLGEADTIRRYMSKKKADKFAAYKDKFIDGLVHAGATKKDAEDFWDQLLEFSKYAFNKSHATAYAIVSFYTAWLKLYYPVQYMTAVLNYTPQDKMAGMVAECKAMGIEVLPPDVNLSEESFSCHSGKILFGLGSVKGVGKAASELISIRREARFTSFRDYLKRSTVNKGVTESLIDAGAMDKWCSSRIAMKTILPDAQKLIKSIAAKQAILDGTDFKKMDDARKKLAMYQEHFERMILPINIPESKADRLEKERELLGMYVSGHPLDEFESVHTERTCMVSEASDGEEEILCGLITGVRQTNRKSDGKPMAFFQLEDESGSIEVCCFTRAYAEFADLVKEGNVVAINGKISSDDSEVYQEDDEPKLQISVSAMKQLSPRMRDVVVSIPYLPCWADNVRNAVLGYKGDMYRVIVHDRMLGEMRRTNITVSGDIFLMNIPGTTVSLFAK